MGKAAARNGRMLGGLHGQEPAYLGVLSWRKYNVDIQQHERVSVWPSQHNIEYVYTFVHQCSTLPCMRIVCSELERAVGTFGSNGIVVDIKCGGYHAHFFDCRWWSDYHEEDECLFLGGMVPFQFLTIRDIPRNVNFKNYIAPITMLQDMLVGSPCALREPINADLKQIRLMIKQEITNTQPKSPIDPYVSRLFHHFCANIKNIVIDMHLMRMRTVGDSDFGYARFAPLFFDSNSVVRFTLFLQFLVNVETFTVCSKDYGHSILFGDSCLRAILDTIKFINSHATLSDSFEAINLVNPAIARNFNINTLILEYSPKFEEKGWTLRKMTYFNPLRRSVCENTLAIGKGANHEPDLPKLHSADIPMFEELLLSQSAMDRKRTSSQVRKHDQHMLAIRASSLPERDSLKIHYLDVETFK